MKFGRFLGRVQGTLRKNVDIHLETVKVIINIFEECLTEIQRQRWSTEIDMIKSYKSNIE